ncbi:hypothetical protein Droror1_Dr00008161 [Drosera rotundifolia]
MYFPIELITDTITRLPEKTLLRFRCVSTTWHDVIESEYFETMHLDLFGKLQKNTCFLALIFPENKWSRVRWFFSNAYTFETISDIPWLTHCYHIEGFVNGLVLLDQTLVDMDGPLFLWNPSIRQHFIIPRNPTFGLSHARVVLGYDASKNDYKVVAMHFRKIVVESNKFPALVMVYSLRNRCWRSLSCSLPAMRTCGKNMHLRGQIYWIACLDKNETFRSDQSWTCVSFDVFQEVFSFIALPSMKRDDDALSISLFVLGMVAAMTSLPVIGVPVRFSSLDGVDIATHGNNNIGGAMACTGVQRVTRKAGALRLRGVPVATVVINNAINAGLLAVRILGNIYPELQARMTQYMDDVRDNVLDKGEKLEKEGWEKYLNP